MTHEVELKQSKYTLSSIRTAVTMLAVLVVACGVLLQLVTGQSGSCNAVTQHLPDPPYDNYFYSDCHVDAQAVVTSPLSSSNLTIIGPRLIVAWPAGNSGICTYFQPQHGPNGTLAVELVNSSYGKPLGPVYQANKSSQYPYVGVQGVLSFNNSATLTVPILGSVRTIRDFTEGPSLLQSVIQDAINVTRYNNTGARLSRLWLDNVTITNFDMVPINKSAPAITIHNKTISFAAGYYHFAAAFNYPQLTQLPPQDVLAPSSQVLIKSQPSQTTSLSFLSYSEKLLAGAWRFLTYFGRDSMISALLMEPILSQGNASATEAVIAAVLERINMTDGSVCHEETIGDYATYLNLQDNITSTAPTFTYPMIDTDLYLPILMSRYFATHPHRIQPLLSRQAGSIDRTNQGLSYYNLTLLNAQKIMNHTAAFAQSQTRQNLLHLKSDQIVGQWRDSTYGIGGGRIPFDVNTGLAPAALRAISQLANMTAVYVSSRVNTTAWSSLAASRAQVWEDSTLQFFEQDLLPTTAHSHLNQFMTKNTFYHGPSHASSLPTNNYTLYSISLQGYDDLSAVNALHSDTSFRLFLLNTTNQPQLTKFLNATATSINLPFPAGLSTGAGMVVANPALSGQAPLIANFTNSAYHGTVVWSWTLAMMGKGLELQLARCNDTMEKPDFCNQKYVYANVRKAYNTLWNGIEKNKAQLQGEVWSWQYSNKTGYEVVPLGSLPAPPGVGAQTESDVRQLWSLTFLAVTRDEALR